MSVMYDHEHERKAHTTSRLQQHTTSFGALPQSHPGLCGTPVGPGKDTHGTPVPDQGRPWVAHNQLHDTTTDYTTDKVLRQTCFQRNQVLRHLDTYMVAEPVAETGDLRRDVVKLREQGRSGDVPDHQVDLAVRPSTSRFTRISTPSGTTPHTSRSRRISALTELLM